MAQRSRWLKGFMQTCITHSREPLETWRQLGSGRFAGAVTMVFGTVASALFYPLFTAVAVFELTRRRGAQEDWLRTLWYLTSLTVFVFGFVVMVVPAFVALKRRRLRRLLPLVPLLPLYYVLVSAAAWRAMWELIRDPFRWNKTEHGGAQTSRTGSLIAASGRSARRTNPEPAVDPVSPRSPEAEHRRLGRKAPLSIRAASAPRARPRWTGD